ncbi:MAG: T9SS type A sorting domain-containing protein [Spirosomataceae bacterium]
MQTHILPFWKKLCFFLFLAGSIFIKTNAQTIVLSNNPICENQQLTLSTEQVAGAIYSWTGPNGFTATTNQANISNVSMANAGQYWLTVNNSGSITTSSVAVSVNPTPVRPTTANVTTCSDSNPINLVATSAGGPGKTLIWYGTNSSGGTGSTTPPIFYPTDPGVVEFYVSQRDDVTGCESERANILVTVNPKPNPPIVTNVTYKQGDNPVSLTASTLIWEQTIWYGGNSTGGVGNLNPPIPSTSIVGTFTYYVSSRSLQTGCESLRAVLLVTVEATILQPQIVANLPICAGNSLNLLSANEYETYSWVGPNGFSSTLRNPSIPNVSSLNTGSYQLTVSSQGMTNSALVYVSVNSVPNSPTLVSNQRCGAGQLTLSATCAAGSPVWFSSMTATSSVGSGNTFTTPLLTQSTSYFVHCNNNGCTSNRVNTTAVINLPPTLIATGSTVCQGQTAILSSVAAGGSIFMYSWTGPNGFTANTQNVTRVNASTLMSGVYSVTVMNTVGCTATATTSITVNLKPIITVNSAIANEGTNAVLNASGGLIYNWSGPNSFTSTSQNPVINNVNQSNAGIYTVIGTNAFGCSSTATTVLTVINKPTPPIVSPVQYCAGDLSIPLVASVLPNHTVLWYGTNSVGGVGITIAPIPSTMVAGTTQFYVSQRDNSSGLESERASLTVLINPRPNLPAANDSIVYCQGQVANQLSVPNANGNEVLWYGTNPASGMTSNTAPIPNTNTIGTTNYFVGYRNELGCKSDLKSIAVVVYPTPEAPALSNISVCEGSTPIGLSAVPLPNHSLNWYYEGIGSSVSPIHDPNTSGSFMYYVSQISTNGCESAVATLTITVNPKPKILNQNGVIDACVGAGTITLSANPSPNHTLVWYNSPTGAALSSPPVHNPSAEGIFNYYFLQINQFGCESDKDSILIRVYPNPIAPAVSSISYCQNAVASGLIATASSGNTLIWYGTNSTGGQGLSSPTIPATNSVGSFNYYVSQKNAFCESARAIINVSIKPTPTISATTNSPVLVGQTLNLSANAGVGAIYSWTGVGGFVSTVQNPSLSNVQISQAGIYVVTANLNGCTATASVLITINQPIPTNHFIYQDALGAGWGFSAVNTTLNFSNLSPVQQGLKSLSVRYNSSFSYLRLSRSTPISLSGYTHLKLRVHGGTKGKQKVNIKINNITASFSFSATANQWTLISIPLSTFGTVSTLSDIYFCNNHTSAQPVFYLDNIYLATSANARTMNENEEIVEYNLEQLTDEVVTKEKDFLVYPNPVNEGERILKLKLEGYDKFNNALIEITDNQGFVIKKIDKQLIGGDSIIELPNLKSGIYFIKIIDGETTKSKRVVVN